jgi:hypothetical protein
MSSEDKKPAGFREVITLVVGVLILWVLFICLVIVPSKDNGVIVNVSQGCCQCQDKSICLTESDLNRLIPKSEPPKIIIPKKRTRLAEIRSDKIKESYQQGLTKQNKAIIEDEIWGDNEEDLAISKKSTIEEEIWREDGTISNLRQEFLLYPNIPLYSNFQTQMPLNTVANTNQVSEPLSLGLFVLGIGLMGLKRLV